MLEATMRVFKQKPHTLTFLSCAAAVPAWIKNYGLATIPDVSFCKHFVPWCGVCGGFYSVANVLVGMSVGSGGDDNEGDKKKSGNRSKLLVVVMAAITFAFVIVLSYYAKQELQAQLKELDKEEKEEERLSRLSMDGREIKEEEVERNKTRKSITNMV
ncbi:hypothetical protein TL16_g10709 [Triparma laevis f. inornata]|uniref:Transmembrane protein n=1 Tax=Triparma laevis f. inornata TaxID=1714386 RepID=A0A9W7BG16_9STRA|nr:hypothetical protein TL16_g10709 [Triparma laevis f. inornata]